MYDITHKLFVNTTLENQNVYYVNSGERRANKKSLGNVLSLNLSN